VHFVGGQTPNSYTFNYLAPTLSSVSPTNSPTKGGVVLTISGTNFGLTGNVTVGGAPCPLTGLGYRQAVLFQLETVSAKSSYLQKTKTAMLPL
jgi:hypothetical protein